ncbi:aldose 1-epimerase [Azospirillum sp. SYSU D00513]|uniref:aldose 1-epimerase n=1 Tax=Azospirillum sp. SYSU D00513 TaxID=2812561 RepID=UPI001A9642B4|nr:aldose 1-epimerase [Azospirillum sp. SYSU D00513]
MLDALEMVTLRSGALECVLNPRCGGSIGRLTWHGPTAGGGPVELMRPAAEQRMRDGSAHDMACYPLFPFSNRIAEGRFHFAGRDVALPLNQPPCPHAIHGHGWTSAWQVDRCDAASARLSFRHAAGAWPWSYTAVQTFGLEPDAITVTLDLTNEGDTPMPSGMGLHPHFPKPAGTRVTARLGSVWMNDAAMLPDQRITLPEEWAFTGGAVMDELVLDNCFAGWDGEAFIAWPDRKLGLSVTAEGPYGHLVVYAPMGGDFFCLEPVTHMTDAHNRPEESDSGLLSLAPGERLSTTVRFAIEVL